MLHCPGPVNNIVVVRQQLYNNQAIPNSQASSKRHGSLLPPLEKYGNSADDDPETKTVIGFQGAGDKYLESMYRSSFVTNNQIKELQVFIFQF